MPLPVMCRYRAVECQRGRVHRALTRSTRSTHRPGQDQGERTSLQENELVVACLGPYARATSALRRRWAMQTVTQGDAAHDYNNGNEEKTPRIEDRGGRHEPNNHVRLRVVRRLALPPGREPESETAGLARRLDGVELSSPDPWWPLAAPWPKAERLSGDSGGDEAGRC